MEDSTFFCSALISNQYGEAALAERIITTTPHDNLLYTKRNIRAARVYLGRTEIIDGKFALFH